VKVEKSKIKDKKYMNLTRKVRIIKNKKALNEKKKNNYEANNY